MQKNIKLNRKSYRKSLIIIVAIINIGIVVALALGAIGLSTPDRNASSKPDINTAVANYDKMLSEMRSRISEARPGTQWISENNAGRGPVSGSSNEVAFSDVWYFEGTLATPSSLRSEVLEILEDVGEKYGFSKPAIYVDRPDEIQIVADDQLGTEYKLGSKINTTLSYATGPLSNSNNYSTD